MNQPASSAGSCQRDEFSALYNGCAQWLYGYLLSLLRRPDDAEEVLQQTAELLWEKFEHYHRGTEFRAWACRVAHFKALEHQQKSRRRKTVFSDLCFQSVDEDAVVMADRLDARAVALEKCLEKLPPADRQVIDQRYAAGGSVESVAQALACSTHIVYRTLSRIHEALFRCINRALAEEAVP